MMLIRSIKLKCCFALLTLLMTFSSLSVEEWRDPEIFRINKEPARSFFYSYDNKVALVAEEPWQQNNHQLLNGQWKFNWVDQIGRAHV